jgi:hypothetical protein
MAKKSTKKTVEEVVEEIKDDGIKVEVVVEEPKKEEPMADKKEMKAEEPTFKVISMNGKLMRSYSNGKLGAALTEDYEA